MKQRLTLLISAVAILGILVAASVTVLQPPSVKSTYPTTIIDDLGRKVAVASEPTRIVSLVPSSTEIIFAIGAGSKIVGVTRYDKHPQELVDMVKKGEVAVVGGGFDPDIEKIVAMKPDLILANGPSQRSALARFEELGLTVVYSNPKDIVSLLVNIRLLGNVTNSAAGAEKLVMDLKQKIEVLSGKVKDRPRVRVYVELASDPLISASKGSFVDELVVVAGGVNVFQNMSALFPTVSSEAVIVLNPEVIIVTSASHIEQVKQRQGWHIVDAVKKNRVYAVDGILFAPSPRIVQGLEEIAQALHSVKS